MNPIRMIHSPAAPQLLCPSDSTRVPMLVGAPRLSEQQQSPHFNLDFVQGVI